METVINQLFEFAINHWPMVAAFASTLALLIFTESRKGGTTLSTIGATDLINKQNAVVIDVRSAKDFSNGHILSAINIPLADTDKRMDEIAKHKDNPILLVCNMGHSTSALAKKMLADGYNVSRLKGGMTEWRNQHMPVVKK